MPRSCSIAAIAAVAAAVLSIPPPFLSVSALSVHSVSQSQYIQTPGVRVLSMHQVNEPSSAAIQPQLPQSSSPPQSSSSLGGGASPTPLPYHTDKDGKTGNADPLSVASSPHSSGLSAVAPSPSFGMPSLDSQPSLPNPFSPPSPTPASVSAKSKSSLPPPRIGATVEEGCPVCFRQKGSPNSPDNHQHPSPSSESPASPLPSSSSSLMIPSPHNSPWTSRLAARIDSYLGAAPTSPLSSPSSVATSSSSPFSHLASRLSSVRSLISSTDSVYRGYGEQARAIQEKELNRKKEIEEAVERKLKEQEERLEKQRMEMERVATRRASEVVLKLIEKVSRPGSGREGVENHAGDVSFVEGKANAEHRAKEDDEPAYGLPLPPSESWNQNIESQQQLQSQPPTMSMGTPIQPYQSQLQQQFLQQQQQQHVQQQYLQEQQPAALPATANLFLFPNNRPPPDTLQPSYAPNTLFSAAGGYEPQQMLMR